MPNRISESDLILPALYCIHNAAQGTLNTTALMQCLRDLLQPSGADIEILSQRNDDKFSQKVRNLRSHKTLERLGLCAYTNGHWRLTTHGEAYLAAQAPILDYLLNNGFSYTDISQTLANITPETPVAPPSTPRYFDENIIISEGYRQETRQQVARRSARLRQAAIEHYTRDGRIVCAVCDFDFEHVYGELGRGFIEIHHQVPIVAYTEEDVERTLQEALANVVPLCANCHRMIHRSRNHMLTVDELRAIVQHNLRG